MAFIVDNKLPQAVRLDYTVSGERRTVVLRPSGHAVIDADGIDALSRSAVEVLIPRGYIRVRDLDARLHQPAKPTDWSWSPPPAAGAAALTGSFVHHVRTDYVLNGTVSGTGATSGTPRRGRHISGTATGSAAATGSVVYAPGVSGKIGTGVLGTTFVIGA